MKECNLFVIAWCTRICMYVCTSLCHLCTNNHNHGIFHNFETKNSSIIDEIPTLTLQLSFPLPNNYPFQRLRRSTTIVLILIALLFLSLFSYRLELCFSFSHSRMRSIYAHRHKENGNLSLSVVRSFPDCHLVFLSWISVHMMNMNSDEWRISTYIHIMHGNSSYHKTGRQLNVGRCAFLFQWLFIEQWKYVLTMLAYISSLSLFISVYSIFYLVLKWKNTLYVSINNQSKCLMELIEEICIVNSNIYTYVMFSILTHIIFNDIL